MDSPVEKQGSLPAGWYADPYGSGLTKWWDGTGWTEAEWEARSEQPPATKDPRTAIGARVRVYNLFIWVLASLPIAQWMVVAGKGAVPLDADGILNALWNLCTVSLFYVAMVVMGQWDWRSLRNIGVVRPFHWARAFLLAIQVIGRTMIVRQVAPGGGLAPIWLVIADILIGLFMRSSQ